MRSRCPFHTSKQVFTIARPRTAPSMEIAAIPLPDDIKPHAYALIEADTGTRIDILGRQLIGPITDPNRLNCRPNPRDDSMEVPDGLFSDKTKITPKRFAHLSAIAVKGGQTVPEKKREHLRKAFAASAAARSIR